jgi:gliding motility-associated-like protein
MNKILLLLLFTASVVGYSQITINEALTTQQLVEDILIDSPCAQVSLFTQSTGTDFGDVNGIAAFDANGSGFPFTSGVVLSSGNVASAPGPNTSLLSEGGIGWPGDTDLEAATSASNTNNASFIQFNFVPLISNISFDFIMASEEYNDNFECTFSDAFAFILTDNVTGVTQNLAVLPGTATPIEVTNIRYEVIGQCAAVNEIYFAQYNFQPIANPLAPSVPAAGAPINFNGQTVELTASGNVVPGNDYTIKLVVADESDTAYDISVYLEAGSFNIGVDLGPDVTIMNGNPACQGTAFTIGVAPTLGSVYVWYKFSLATGMFEIIPGEIFSTYNVTSDGTYRIEVTSSSGCAAMDDIEVEFAPQPIAVEPDKITICDELPNDGLGEFDLTIRDAQIINGQVGVTVTYYTTLAGAEAGGFPIATPMAFTNLNPGFDTVWARLEEDLFGCYDIVELDLQVNDSPAITDPISDYFLCDNDGDGTEVFDLRTKDAEILNTLTNVTLSYYESEADALVPINPISPDTAYLSGSTIVWVRAENSDPQGFMCIEVASFNLILGQAPLFVVVDPYVACDNDGDGLEDFDLAGLYSVISDGNFALSVSFHPTQLDADLDTNGISSPYSSAGGEIIYVRIEDSVTGCYASYPMTLVVEPPPVINMMVTPLIYCDDDNDGFGEFNLPDADSEVTFGNPGGNLVVSYHYTFADAQNDQLALASPYLNDVPYLQTVYVRVLDLATGCYNITTLDLVVFDSPILTDPAILEVCDDNGDGFWEFDLTVVEPEILAGLLGGPYVVNYFTDPGLTSPIGTPTAYTNTTNPQTIYIQVRDTATDCIDTTELILQVNLPPALVNPDPLTACDVTEVVGPGVDDEVEIFDLTDSIFQITGGDVSIVVAFYGSLADFNADIPIVDSTMYANLSNPQTIYIKGAFGDTGCEIADTTVTLDLIVNPLPSPLEPTPLQACDEDGDGLVLFDINSKILEIIDGEPGVSVSFHESFFDAQNGTAALLSPYENISTPTQIIYARAIYPPLGGGSGCFSIVELELEVLDSPLMPIAISDLVVCDDDGTAEFDLTLKAEEILNGQDPVDYILSYHNTSGDAISGANPIVTPQSYSSTPPETIHVRLVSVDNGCVVTGSFELVITLGPGITNPDPLRLCDDLGMMNDEVRLFDLTLRNDQITGGNLNMGVRYYVTEADIPVDDYISPDTAYQNISNPQTLFVRVLDSNTGCEAFTTLTIGVVPNPQPGIPDALELCDVDMPGDEMELFDLTVAGPQIQLNPLWVLTYHESYDEAFVLGGITVPNETMYQNTSNPQIVYVRVTNPSTPEACFEIVELTLIVNPLPDDSVDLGDLVICDEVPTDGFAIFNLTLEKLNLLGPIQAANEADYEIRFYRSDVDAIAGVNAIAFPDNFQNEQNPQTIWTRITNTVTGCLVAGSQNFDLVVQDGAMATDPSEAYIICDNLDPNDGIALFDLTTQEAEILNGQDPLIYVVTFHITLEDADAGTNAVVDQANYQNEINPQRIFARVTNTANAAMPQCASVASLLLKVEQLPEIIFEDNYRLCVDANGNPIPEEEGSLSPPVIDTGLDESLYLFMWELNGVSLPDIGASIVAIAGGTYTVIITEIATGCTATYTTEVVVSSPPLTYGANVISGAFANTHVIEATATGDGSYVFQLDDGPFQDSGIFENVLAGDHIITIKDIFGCGSVMIPVGVIDYPRFFTPNEDAYNNRWNIIGIASGDPMAKIYIFDRYGKLLKQISPLGDGWDGTYNGNPLPSSDYWFQVEYTENETRKEFRGHFTLKR